MSQNVAVRWLVTYDIGDKRRLSRVFRLLKKRGVPIQYSVFSVQASAVAIRSLMRELSELIEHREDDIRAYQLPSQGWQITLGSSILPEGVWLEAGGKL